MAEIRRGNGHERRGQRRQHEKLDKINKAKKARGSQREPRAQEPHINSVRRRTDRKSERQRKTCLGVGNGRLFGSGVQQW